MYPRLWTRSRACVNSVLNTPTGEHPISQVSFATSDRSMSPTGGQHDAHDWASRTTARTAAVSPMVMVASLAADRAGR